MAKKSGYHIVYKATSPSGKIYIGYTHFTLRERILMHFSESRKNLKRPFYNCLRKYGKFVKWEIVATYQTEKFAKNREQFFISKFKSTTLKFGYNCTKGGEGTLGLVRNSQRKKIIDSKGVIYNGIVEASRILNISNCTLKNAVRNSYWCKGNYFSYYKEGMIVADLPISKNPKGQRKVINVTTGEIFNSIKEAAEKYNVAPQRLYQVCIGKRFKTRGQIFKYLEGK